MRSRIQNRLRLTILLLAVTALVLGVAGIQRVTRAAAGPAPQASGYHVTKKYPVGGDGGWDYLTADGPNHRLFISRGTHVMIVDMETGKVTGDIPDTQGVHGIALATEFNRGYTSNGRSGNATIFDLKTLATIGAAKTGDGPDAILYDSASKRIFTFNGRSNDATAIDAASGTVAGTIPLGGKPETAVADGTGHVFVNIEDKSEIVDIDSKTLKEVHRWPLTGCEEPSGMAIDVKHRRTFSGCHNKVMAVLNIDTGKVVATPAIGAGVDANGFDPETQLAFSSNGDGTLTVVHEDTPDTYTIVDNVSTQRGARTMTLDPKTHIVYLVTAEYGPAPEPGKRPPMLANSFTILVVGK